MSAPFLSSAWYRVDGLHAQLSEHVHVHIHRYQGKVWYILQDGLTGQTHRLAPSAYMFVSMLDRGRTINEVWLELVDRLGNTAPSQDEVIALLGRLYAAEMLRTEVPPDARELLRRFERKEGMWIKQTLLNPIAVKLPLWDPDAFLDHTVRWVSWLSGWIGALLWLGVVGRAAVLTAQHWTDLTANSLDRVLGVNNLALLSLSFIVIKAIHELGHAYAIKALGGEVHELGVMLLVFFPAPYVDASFSTAFRSKWQRMLVGSAGILIEIFIAALALEVWLAVGPGAVRSVAFNVMLVASVSTLIFNGNPLLRYDGYYVLADWIEIPNLASRASTYWRYLCDRYLLKVQEAESPASNGKERFWFAIYAPLSFGYRLLVMINIALLVASRFLVVGTIIAVWTLYGGLVRPVWRAARHLLHAGRYHRERRRVVATAAALAAVAVAFVLLVPIPLHTSSQGVIWLPESAIVRAGADGFIRQQALVPGARVHRGDLLVTSEDPALTEKVRELEGKRDELRVQLTVDRETNRVDQNLTRIRLDQTNAELARQRQKLGGLVAASGDEGTLVVPRPEELAGGFQKRGEILAFVAPASSPIVRATVEQDNIGLVRNHLRTVKVLLASDTRRAFHASIIREVPGAVGELPSRALGLQGGGKVATDPRDPGGTKTISRLFQFDLQMPANAPTMALGSRVYVRFEHEWEPIGVQVYRRVRQLLLSRLRG